MWQPRRVTIHNNADSSDEDFSRPGTSQRRRGNYYVEDPWNLQDASREEVNERDWRQRYAGTTWDRSSNLPSRFARRTPYNEPPSLNSPHDVVVVKRMPIPVAQLPFNNDFPTFSSDQILSILVESSPDAALRCLRLSPKDIRRTVDLVDFRRRQRDADPSMDMDWSKPLSHTTDQSDNLILSSLNYLDLPLGPQAKFALLAKHGPAFTGEFEEALRSGRRPQPTIKERLACLDGCAVNALVAFADPLKHIQLSTYHKEDSLNSKQLKKLNEDIHIEDLTKQISEQTARVDVPNTDITLILGAGGVAVDIIFNGGDLVLQNKYNERYRYRQETLMHHGQILPFFDSRTTDEWTLIRHTSRIKANEALKKKEYQKKIMKRPRCGVFGSWNDVPLDVKCCVELTWDRIPTTQFKFICDSANKVSECLLRNGWNGHHILYTHNNSAFGHYMIRVPVENNKHSIESDIKHLEAILKANDIQHSPIGLQKSEHNEAALRTNVDSIMIINRNLCAFTRRAFHPRHIRGAGRPELVVSAPPYPWKIDIETDGDKNKAIVVFENIEMAEVLTEMMQRKSLNRNWFTINNSDKKGVSFRSKFSVSRAFSNILVWLMYERLASLMNRCKTLSRNSLDQQRTNGRCVEIKVTTPNLRQDATSEERIVTVEGFPFDLVNEISEQVNVAFEGRKMDLTDDQAKFLVSGIGRTMAEEVAKTALVERKALVEFSVVGKEIFVFGEVRNTNKIEEELVNIAQNRDMHRVNLDISLSLPNYVDQLADAINFMGLPRLEKLIGLDCRLSVNTSDPLNRTINFKGSLVALKNLEEYLAKVDTILRKDTWKKIQWTKEFDPKKHEELPMLSCSLCLNRVSMDFYCLERCGHYYCMECLVTQFTNEMAFLPLKCAQCDEKICISDILRLLLGERSLNSPASTIHPSQSILRLRPLEAYKLQRLVQSALTNALDANPDRLMQCRTINCKGVHGIRANIPSFISRPLNDTRPLLGIPLEYYYHDMSRNINWHRFLTISIDGPPGLDSGDIGPPPSLEKKNLPSEGLTREAKEAQLRERLGTHVEVVLSENRAGSRELESCGACSSHICTLCGREPHPEFSCALSYRAQEYQDISPDQLDSDQYKRCPHCNVITTKEPEGCFHMTCSKCQGHFCWACGAMGNTDREIYAHLSEAHGTYGGDGDEIIRNAMREMEGVHADFPNIFRMLNIHPARHMRDRWDDNDDIWDARNIGWTDDDDEVEWG